MKPMTMDKGFQMKATKVGMKVGPWGGVGGREWDDGSHSGVKDIILLYGQCIHSIRFLYDKHGKSILADRHGGSGGNLTAQVSLNYPEEFLTAVSGHHSPTVEGGPTVVRSLSFKSNQREFGPYGVEEGTPFSLPMDGVTVVGFHGRSGCYLEAIGCSLSPLRAPNVLDKMHHKLQKKVLVAHRPSSD